MSVVFVDTNVLLYFVDATEGSKQARAKAWMEKLWSERTGRLSTQVLNEFYVNATRKLSMPLDTLQARKLVRSLLAWKPVALGEATLEKAWELEEQYAVSWWDALILAASMQAGCTHLLSEDLQHGQNMGSVRVLNPFRVAPSDLP